MSVLRFAPSLKMLLASSIVFALFIAAKFFFLYMFDPWTTDWVSNITPKVICVDDGINISDGGRIFTNIKCTTPTMVYTQVDYLNATEFNLFRNGHQDIYCKHFVTKWFRQTAMNCQTTPYKD